MHGNDEALGGLEDRLTQLRRSLRAAMLQRDTPRIKELRNELRRVEAEWEAVVAEDEAPASQAIEPVREAAVPMLPVREQVHQVLTLLGVAAPPKLISAVHGALFTGDLQPSRLASLRRDEERSYRSAPNSRPYYLCPALTADMLAPARALITVSTWPLERRIIGGHSPRVDYLTSAKNVAEAVTARRRLGGAWDPNAMAQAERLLRGFAMNIPGAIPLEKQAAAIQPVDPDTVAHAADAELSQHLGIDERERAQAAARARRQLGEAERLFGSRLGTVGRTANMER